VPPIKQREARKADSRHEQERDGGNEKVLGPDGFFRAPRRARMASKSV